MNGEVLTFEELEKRLLVFAESARLTESRSFLILDCDRLAAGEEMVGILALLEKTGVNQVILPDYRWIFEPRPTPLPPPQIEPSAHSVELK